MADEENRIDSKDLPPGVGSLLEQEVDAGELPHEFEQSVFFGGEEDSTVRVRPQAPMAAHRQALQDELTDIGLGDDERRFVMSLSLANRYQDSMSHQRQYKVEVNQPKAAGLSIGDFEINIEQNSIQKMLPDFDVSKFPDKASAIFTYTQLLNKLLRMVKDTPENKDKRDLIETALSQVNISEAVLLANADIVKNSVHRNHTNTLAEPHLNPRFVKAPLLGRVDTIDPAVYRSLNSAIGLGGFSGQDKKGKPLSHVLKVVKNHIYGKYSQKAAFSILLHCLSGKAFQIASSFEDDSRSFGSCFYFLQSIFDAESDTFVMEDELKKLLEKGGVPLREAIATIYSTNRAIRTHMASYERSLSCEAASKSDLFLYLRRYFPSFYATILQNYNNMITSVRQMGAEKTFNGYQALASIAIQVCQGSKPLSRHSADIVGISEVGIPGREAEGAAAAADSVSQKKSPGGFQKPSEDPAYANHCFLCFKIGHGYRQCRTYSGARLGNKCSLCNGFHLPLPCKAAVNTAEAVEVEEE